MNNDVIAVLDIGKTNKKVLIYDKGLTVLDKETKAFGEVVGEGGIKLEQPESVFEWFVSVLKTFSSSYNIQAISVTTHGAMGVCVDAGGEITCPPLAYTNEPGQEFCDSFFAEFGDRKTLQSQTATAEIGEMINFAKMIHYWKQHCPEKLQNAEHILYYPQYFGFKLTGKAAVDTTMLGCHTYLYDHEKNGYSKIAEKLGVLDKLPQNISNSWDVIGTVTEQIAEQTGLSTDCVVTTGVHDSNASLLPFLITEKGDFVLNSNGTWCVAMKPAENVSFKQDELGKTVFYNRDVFGKPVKTSIFMGVLEYETYTKLFSNIHGRDDLPDFNSDLYKSVLEKCDWFILPSIVKGAGLFPTARPMLVDGDKVVPLDEFGAGRDKPDFADDYELSMAVLICSLAVQTYCALEAAGYADGGDIFVEGGFRLNQPYLDLLTAFYPESNIYKTNINEATALGSAILARAALDGKTPRDIQVDLAIEKQHVEKVSGLSVDNYRKSFLSLIS